MDKEKIKRAKALVQEHVQEHKTAYISVGVGLLSATFTYIIMRSNTARGGVLDDVARGGAINKASLIFRNSQNINVTTVLDREGRGHPGWPVRNLETKKVFLSQREAAQAFGIAEGLLSGHLKGKFPDVDGLHFERINLMPAT